MARRRAGVSGSARALPSFSEQTPVKLRSADVTPNPSYRYTTPSFSGKRSPAERRERGCIEVPKDRWCFRPEGVKSDKCFHSEAEAVENASGKLVKYKPEKRFSGERCRSGKPDETCKDKSYDAFCAGHNVEPCNSPRSTCPVQLVWVEGKPNLRFCKVQGEPGHMVAVSDVREAMAVSEEACRDWPYKLGVVERADGSETKGGWDPEFFERNAPEVVQRARKSYPQRSGLGQAPRPASGSPLFLVGGTVLGLLAALWMQKTA